MLRIQMELFQTILAKNDILHILTGSSFQYREPDFVK